MDTYWTFTYKLYFGISLGLLDTCSFVVVCSAIYQVIERLHVASLMMSHDVIKFNFHTMSLPILLAIGSCPEKLQVKFESVSSYA